MSTVQSGSSEWDYLERHNLIMGYCLWVFGFIGAHRFYFGKKLTGILWFFTLGLLFVGWFIDLFLVPSMMQYANRRYTDGSTSYSLAWILLIFLGAFGVHRMYMGKWITGIIYLVTLGLFGVGIIYDFLTLNEQVDGLNRGEQPVFI